MWGGIGGEIVNFNNPLVYAGTVPLDYRLHKKNGLLRTNSPVREMRATGATSVDTVHGILIPWCAVWPETGRSVPGTSHPLTLIAPTRLIDAS